MGLTNATCLIRFLNPVNLVNPVLKTFARRAAGAGGGTCDTRHAVLHLGNHSRHHRRAGADAKLNHLILREFA